ncbi:MAG: hypothetical protein ACLSFC_20380, partial [Enterocloster bolteae]
VILYPILKTCQDGQSASCRRNFVRDCFGILRNRISGRDQGAALLVVKNVCRRQQNLMLGLNWMGEYDMMQK